MEMINRTEHLVGYQEQQRERTRRAIKEAILYLRENGVAVTKKNIAEESGLHPNTLCKPYVQDYLKQFEEFASKDSNKEDTEKMAIRIKELEDQLAHSKNYNNRLSEECRIAREKAEEWEKRFRRLLGKYQSDIGKKKIGF